MPEAIGIATFVVLVTILAAFWRYNHRANRIHHASLERLSLQLQARLPDALRKIGAGVTSGEKDGISWEMTPRMLDYTGLAVPGVRIVVRPVLTTLHLTAASPPDPARCGPEEAAALTFETRTLLAPLLRRGAVVQHGGITAEEELRPDIDPLVVRLPTILDIAARLRPAPAQILPRLLQNLADPEPAWRARSLRLLAAHYRASLDPARLRGLLTDPDPAVRLEAACLLPDMPTLDALTDAAHPIEIRRQALLRLDDDRFAHRATFLLGFPDPILAAIAEAALDRQITDLLPHLEAAILLISATDEAAAPSLFGGQPTPHPELSALIRTFAALSPQPSPEAESVLLSCRDRPDVRVELLRALAAVGGSASLPLIEESRGLLRPAPVRQAADEAEAAIRARLSQHAGGLSIADAGGLSIADAGGLSISRGGEPRKDQRPR